MCGIQMLNWECMKTKYPNFRYPGSSAPDPTFVPSHLIRKHWSIQLVEMYQIVLCIILFFSMSAAYPKIGVIAVPSFLALLFSFAIGTFFSIMDNYRYKVIVQISHTIVALVFGAAAFLYSDVFELFIGVSGASALSVFIVTFPEKNRAYYAWCKSIAN